MGGGNTKKRYGTSIYKGVSKHSSGKWKASITVNGELQYLGLFTDEWDAAEAYNVAAIVNHGDFANINHRIMG
jgi:hypothetical protein